MIQRRNLLKELNTPLETPTGEQIFSKPQRRAPPNSDRNKVFMWQNSPVQPKDVPSRSDGSHTFPFDTCVLDTSNSSTVNGNKLKLSPISNGIRRQNEGVDTTGQLAMDANGQYRYLGKSSGFYLLQKSRTYHHGAFHLSGNQQRTPLYSGSSLAPSSSSSSSSSSSPSPSPPTATNTRSTSTDPFELPPPDLSTALIQLYFRNFYPSLPMFYKKQLSSSLDDPSELISPLLLNAIYAVASRISDDPQVRSDPKLQETAGDIFFERAKLLLDSHYDIPRISTVQALLLLSSHQQGTKKSARAWLYSGMAFRMALDLGLNRNCDHWQIPPDEKERRKRVFWCCFICDKTSSATFGRSSIFEESDCDVPFPNIDDDEPVFTACTHSTIPPPGPLMVLTHLVSICDILGHVLKNIYYAKALQHSDMRHISHVVSSLTGRLTHWYRTLPSSLRMENTNQSQPDTIYPICVSQLHMVYHATVILLHRLFIPNNAADISPESICEYNICVESATSIMNIANNMLKTNILKFSFHSTVYFIFTAGIIFINSASSNDATKSFDAKVNINNIMRLLEELEKTWTSASRSANILGELAGLRDLNLPTSENTLRPIVHRGPNYPISSSTAPSSSSSTSSPKGYYSAASSPIDSAEVNMGLHSSTSTAMDNYGEMKRRHFSHGERKWNQHNIMMDEFSNNATFNSNLQESGYRDVSHRDMQQQQRQQQQQQQQQSLTKGNMDPFAAPDTIPVSFPQKQFDISGAAFWGVPPSLDLNEWNQYLGTQLPAYQQQQQQQHLQTMPNVSMSSTSSTPSSTTNVSSLPQHQSQTTSSSTSLGTSTQPHLIPSRSIISQYPPTSKSSSTPASGPFTSMMHSTATQSGDLSNNGDNMVSTSTTTTVPLYNRRPSTLTSSTLSNVSSPGTRYTRKHLIHSDANVDILSGMPIPLDLPESNSGGSGVDSTTSSLFGLLGDQQGTVGGDSSNGFGASDLLGDSQSRSTDFYGGDSMIYY
ncbi:unnamed protein product [Absidia cylindrospora]